MLFSESYKNQRFPIENTSPNKHIMRLSILSKLTNWYRVLALSYTIFKYTAFTTQWYKSKTLPVNKNLTKWWKFWNPIQVLTTYQWWSWTATNPAHISHSYHPTLFNFRKIVLAVFFYIKKEFWEIILCDKKYVIGKVFRNE